MRLRKKIFFLNLIQVIDLQKRVKQPIFNQTEAVQELQYLHIKEMHLTFISLIAALENQILKNCHLSPVGQLTKNS